MYCTKNEGINAAFAHFHYLTKTINDLNIYYYTNERGSCEIDFVIDTGEQIIPVEVKAEDTAWPVTDQDSTL